MIRKACTTNDTMTVLDMAAAFNAQYYSVPLNTDRCAAWITRCIADGIIFLAEDGFIGGALVQDPCRDWTALVEFGWYAKTSGPQLLKAFIEHGKEMGADEVRITTLNTTPRRVETYLRRTGFTLIEKSHRLIL